MSTRDDSHRDWDGRWTNGLGSEVDLVVHGTRVTGRYRTQVGRPDASEVFHVTGFVAGDLIVFTADFGVHGSLTAWTGRRITDADGATRIDALWHLVRSHDDQGNDIAAWASTLAGSASFRPCRDRS